MTPYTLLTAADFGVMIRDLRKQQGLTQKALALAIGTGERFIVDLESGKETARLGLALKAAKLLGVHLAGGNR